jgi:hypothetical protein
VKVNVVSKGEFLDLARNRRDEFLARIAEPQAFAVKSFYDRDAIIAFRNDVFRRGQETEPSWHPLVDDCPDYHRLHDNYPKAYVKAKMHAFYFHGWYPHNKRIFEFFKEIFHLKNFLAGFQDGEFMHNIPSDGFIARVNVHHYPRGGGYQAEHIDPVGKHAQIQTLIIGSEFGQDYRQGGVYGRSAAASPATYLDPLVGPGDMLVMSPGIPHGVAAIDPDADYEWKSNNGRWMILPIIVGSDYPNPAVAKPIEVSGVIS